MALGGGGLIAPPSALPGAALIGVAVLLVPGLVWAVVHRLRLGEEPLHRCLLAGLLYPGFLVLGVIATWRALFRVLARRNSWTKTERLNEDEAVPVGAA
ncbi:hypothetical protein [Amycolatopsis speibonae]|uniref:Uncharacterized protein n=1 Tax=Amycolatopsis speibonae TaxID=1450224 RepID=A0ABV7NT72_9PSEU